MAEQVNVGFIGAGGFISAHHLVTAAVSPYLRIGAIADLNAETLAKHAAKYDVGYTVQDYRKLLADDAIDLIVIGTKQDLHAELIVAALDAGKWVLCEKPMANSEEESLRVLEAERRAQGRLAIGFNRRFAPACRRAKALMQQARRPWFVNYRMMNQSSHVVDGFYKNQPRIIYEGCHLLDLARWFFDADPVSVYMTGDRLRNHCCILSFADGSQFQLLCGSVGATAFWKENMEIYGQDKTICINDFVDMRVRGFENESDSLYPPYRNEHGADVLKYGFEFYEMYQACFRDDYVNPKFRVDWAKYGVANVLPKRPRELPFKLEFVRENPDILTFTANKGWYESLEHFGRCFLEHRKPDNASGADGARATELGLALLESLDRNRPVPFQPESRKFDREIEHNQQTGGKKNA